MSPEIGTPCGSSQLGHRWTLFDRDGEARGGVSGRPARGIRRLPVHGPGGGSAVSPSHHGSFWGVRATLVKMVLERTRPMAFQLVLRARIGRDAEEAALGFTARS